MISNPVAFTIPSDGIPSRKMLNNLPNPNDRNNRKVEIAADFLNGLLKLPKKESKAVANNNIPKDRTSFNALAFSAISIPSFALMFIGLNMVKEPIAVKINPEINK